MNINYYVSSNGKKHGVTRYKETLTNLFDSQTTVIPEFEGKHNLIKKFSLLNFGLVAKNPSHALDIRDSVKNIDIVSIHDMIPWIEKDFYKRYGVNSKWIENLRNTFHHNLQKAKYRIAISEESKYQAEKLGYSISKVINHVVNQYTQNIAKEFTKRLDDFFLIVGSNDPRKNWETAIYAAAYWKKKLVWIGHSLNAEIGKNYELKIIKLAKKLKVKLVRISDSTDDILNDAYQKTSALLVTSISEGFCLPVIEALTFNCPVINLTPEYTNWFDRIYKCLGPISIEDINEARKYDWKQIRKEIDERINFTDIEKYKHSYLEVYEKVIE